MKNLIIALLAVTVFLIGSCRDGEDLTPQEKFVGTWVGLVNPTSDTLRFFADGTARLYGEFGVGALQNYEAFDDRITFYADDGFSQWTTIYRFSKNNLFITLPSVFGIEYSEEYEYRKID